MAAHTPNYDFNLPGVGDAADEDLWGNELNENWSSIDTLLKAVSDKADQAQLPIGSLYFNASVATNPETLLGYGTWTAFGAGRVFLGAGTGTDANGHPETFAAGDTGGDYEVTLTAGQVPALSGTVAARSSVGGQVGSGGPLAGATPSDTTVAVTVNSAGGASHENKQPYITVYAWVRAT